MNGHRKTVVLGISLLGIILLSWGGRLEIDKGVDFMKWLLTSFFASEAYYEGVKYMADKRAAATIIASSTDTKSGLDELKRIGQNAQSLWDSSTGRFANRGRDALHNERRLPRAKKARPPA